MDPNNVVIVSSGDGPPRRISGRPESESDVAASTVVSTTVESTTKLDVVPVPAEPPAPSTQDEGKEDNKNSSLPGFDSFANILFGSPPKWPDAVGAAMAFESETYIVRTLLVSSDNKSSALPFIPQYAPGPPLTPVAPSVLPADTELFVSASLDYTQIYEGMLSASAAHNEVMRRQGRISVKENPPSPFAAFERLMGIKIKDDLLPLLGNEVAVTIPLATLDNSRPPPVAPETTDAGAANEKGSNEKAKQEEGPSIVVAIAIKDREAVKRLIPKIIGSAGFQGAEMFARSEKREDTEIISYMDSFAYAFIGDFLVVSPDIKATRHVVDSYLKNETLSSDSHFRNFTRWQPRQLIGQVYVSPKLMDGLKFADGPGGLLSEQMREFLMRLSPESDPVTYALSTEGLGPLHELHVPKNLVMMLAAGISTGVNQTPLQQNESMAKGLLYMIAGAEKSYATTTGNGNFGSLDQLAEAGLIQKEILQNHGYKIDLVIIGKSFEISATPLEYGKTGTLSFFVNETGVVRGGDKGGGPATVADNPIQ
jgi:hypothetical protein